MPLPLFRRFLLLRRRATYRDAMGRRLLRQVARVGGRLRPGHPDFCSRSSGFRLIEAVSVGQSAGRTSGGYPVGRSSSSRPYAIAR